MPDQKLDRADVTLNLRKAVWDKSKPPAVRAAAAIVAAASDAGLPDKPAE